MSRLFSCCFLDVLKYYVNWHIGVKLVIYTFRTAYLVWGYLRPKRFAVSQSAIESVCNVNAKSASLRNHYR